MIDEFMSRLTAAEPQKVESVKIDKAEAEKKIAHLQAQINRQTKEKTEHEAKVAELQPQVEAWVEEQYQQMLIEKAAQRDELRCQHEAEAEEHRAGLLTDWEARCGKKPQELADAIQQARSEIEGLAAGIEENQ
jgi:predicted RNA-binding protein Jag